MALTLGNFVLETSETTGTGTINLAGATTGFQTFVAGVGDGAEVPYVIKDGTDWEMGTGTVTSGSPDTLSRDTIIESTNSNAAVNWADGVRDVYIFPSSAQFPLKGTDNTFTGDNTFAGNIKFADKADNTKIVAHDISGLTTGTTKTVTYPDKDITLIGVDDVPVLQNYIAGLTLSNDTDTDHDINVTAGQATDSTNASYLNLASEMTKQIDASWAVGDDAGGLFDGTVANDTTYHVFLIKKDSDGSIDVGFDTSLTAANIPSGYTKYRRIGSVLTDGSANILPFTQDGDNFYRDQPIADVNGIQTATTRQTPTLSVPSGISFLTSIRVTTSGGVGTSYYTRISEVVEADSAASPSNHSLALTAAVASANTSISQHMSLRTNASAQIAYRSSSTDASSLIYIFTHGWVDKRGA